MSKIRKLNKDLDALNEIEFCEKSNLGPRVTGMSVAIWVFEKNINTEKHAAKIKVMPHQGDAIQSEMVPVSISRTPEIMKEEGGRKLTLPTWVFKEAEKFIKLNYESLMKHWNREFDIFDLGKVLKKI